MNKSITQATQNDKQISNSIKKFFKRFHVSSALKASNAYKKKGVPVMEIFQYLFLLIFSNRSMYMNLITGRNTPAFAKDTVYRFMKMIQINWIRFTTILSARIIKDAIIPLDSEDRANVLIIDDSMFERNCSKKVELLAKVYDHAKHAYRFGFRMLTLGWSDGSTFLQVNSVLLSTENRQNRINEATDVDKRTVGYRRRKLSMEKGTQAMLTLLDAAKKAAIPANYVLFDSWFSSPSTLHAVKNIGFDVIDMVKKTPKMFFRYNGENMSLTSIYNKNKKRRGRSRYLLSVMVDVVKDGEIIPAKMLLQMFRTMLSDNTELSDEKINELASAFMNTLPAMLKIRLQSHLCAMVQSLHLLQVWTKTIQARRPFTPKSLIKGLPVLTAVSIIMHLQRLQNGISITKNTVLMPSFPKAGLMPA